MVECDECFGGGKLTDDVMRQPMSDLMDEILRDDEKGVHSRTRDAINSGMIKFKTCEVCGGDGQIPLPPL